MKGLVAINGGFVGQRLTGLQRYAWEVSRRMLCDDRVRLIYPATAEPPDLPSRALSPVKPPPLHSHLKAVWDLGLARHLERGELLWSPCNLGPPIHNHAVTIHDLSVRRNPEWFSRGFAAKYRLLIPLLVRRSKLVITDTETVKGELCQFYPWAAGKVLVVPLGVSENLLQASNFPLPEHLRRFTDRPYYVTLGSIDPRKNLAFLLDEWADYQAANHDHRLLVIGGTSGAFRNSQLPKPQNCEFLGYVPDEGVGPLIKGARALIYPSLYEGFSIPPLEAMAMGTPALVSDIPVHRENFSEWAYFFDSRQRGGLSELLKQGDFRIRSPQLLTEALKARFNWDRCAETILSALVGCARGERKE